MSIAGNNRRSASRRSSSNSMLPVPLNSWAITSSTRLPVSIRQVATIVSEPPPSIWRAAPNSRFGTSNAPASMPPLMVRPVAVFRLWARPRRVSESRTITTSRSCKASPTARSRHASAVSRCSSSERSLDEANTSAGTARRKSVTSSGRSSISKAYSIACGAPAAIATHRSLRIVVLPVRGGARMIARWPNPMGQNTSRMRTVSGVSGPTRSILREGAIATRS